jgi:hypothetical protein
MYKYLFYTENNVFGGSFKYMNDLIDGVKNQEIKILAYCNAGGFLNR